MNLHKVVHNILSLLLLLPIGFVGMVLLLFLILAMSFLCLFFHICLAKGKGFLGGWDGKESTCNAGDPGLIPGMWQSPRERNGYPLQYSCLENPMYRGAWHPKMHWVTKCQTWLSNFHFISLIYLFKYLAFDFIILYNFFSHFTDFYLTFSYFLRWKLSRVFFFSF